MLKLPAVVTREIDGFLPAADAVKRGLASKESPEPVGTVGQPLGGELIRQTGNGTEFTKSESEEVSFVELRVKGEPVVAPGPAGLGSIALVKKNQLGEIRDNNGDGLQRDPPLGDHVRLPPLQPQALRGRDQPLPLQARRGQAAPEAAGEHRRPRHGAEGPRLRALY